MRAEIGKYLASDLLLYRADQPEGRQRNRLGLGRQLYRRWIMKYSWHQADLIFINSDYARDHASAWRACHARAK